MNSERNLQRRLKQYFKTSLELARSLKEEGLPIETIVKITGLSESEVEKLKKSNY